MNIIKHKPNSLHATNTTQILHDTVNTSSPLSREGVLVIMHNCITTGQLQDQ